MARRNNVTYEYYQLPLGMMYPFEDKPRSLNKLIRYDLSRTNKMFKYEGLPDTIPDYILELFLQVYGKVAFYRHNDNLYIFRYGEGGEPDVYYRPTIATITNPALNLSVNAVIGTECAVVFNDTMQTGLLPMLERYNSGIVENEISLKIASINARITSLISAQDDRTKESAIQYIRDIIDGKLGVIAETPFLDGIKSQPQSVSGHQVITDLIEYEQYLKASKYNELGLNANYNMKRESINSGESQLNNDALIPLVDDMLRSREEGLKRVNEMFGTNITVQLSSAWEDNQLELDVEQEMLEKQVETDAEPEPDTETEPDTKPATDKEETEDE